MNLKPESPKRGSNSLIVYRNDMLLKLCKPCMSKLGIKKTAKLSKDKRVSLIKRLTDDDQNPNVEQIESIRKAVKIHKKNSRARKIS
jgi:hypothetical protein